MTYRWWKWKEEGKIRFIHDSINALSRISQQFNEYAQYDPSSFHPLYHSKREETIRSLGCSACIESINLQWCVRRYSNLSQRFPK